MCETKVAQVNVPIFFYFREFSKIKDLGPKNGFFINQSINKPK